MRPSGSHTPTLSQVCWSADGTVDATKHSVIAHLFVYLCCLGEYYFVTVTSQQSHVVLTKLSAGTSYIVSVMAMQGRAQSDALTSIITTGTLSRVYTVNRPVVGCCSLSSSKHLHRNCLSSHCLTACVDSYVSYNFGFFSWQCPPLQHILELSM